MSWKKHFTRSNLDLGGARSRANKWQSWLPEVYSGTPNRVERYGQYDAMDQDSEVNASLDTIAEFSTQEHPESGLPFVVNYKDEATESEVNALETSLQQWCNINEFENRLFGIFRSTIKYGDQFFIRDPETWKLMWVQPEDVTKAIINESTGKSIDQYILKNVSLNLQDLVTVDTRKIQNTSVTANQGYTAGRGAGTWQAGYSQNVEFAVDSKHIVHITLSDGMNEGWPFGSSILESVFKVYKQKEMLEDSIIIYRVQRAPERRVFYIDVGNMPAHKAMAMVERVKNEVHQTRIPNKTGGGNNVMDASYNPLSIMEDYFFAQSAEGRGSKVDVLPGGSNLGEIDDLRYFNNKLMRGLRVPSSYLPNGADDGQQTFNDGRLGTALIQEFRFSKYCERLQMMLQQTLDTEFKLFLKNRGVNIPSNLFDLQFTVPQSFSKYKELEVEAQKVQVFGNIEGVDYLSRRFILKKYLGLTEDELADNERLWRDENRKDGALEPDAKGELGSVGVRGSDISSFEPTDIGDEDADIGDDDINIDGDASPITGGGEDQGGADEI
jgi:hypothetical protein